MKSIPPRKSTSFLPCWRNAGFEPRSIDGSGHAMMRSLSGCDPCRRAYLHFSVILHLLPVFGCTGLGAVFFPCFFPIFIYKQVGSRQKYYPRYRLAVTVFFDMPTHLLVVSIRWQVMRCMK